MALTLKAPITTAADDIHKYFFIVFQRILDLMFQVNPLLGRGFTWKIKPYFLRKIKVKKIKMSSAAIFFCALKVKKEKISNGLVVVRAVGVTGQLYLGQSTWKMEPIAPIPWFKKCTHLLLGWQREFSHRKFTQAGIWTHNLLHHNQASLTYMPYLTLWDKISQNSAYLKADSQKNFQISQNF